jgi:hypothetical protein
MKTFRNPLSLLVVAALGAACTTVEPLADGSSARGLVAAQTADPTAGERNGSTVPETDPARAGAAIEAMRGGVTKPTASWTSTVVVGN